MKQLKMIAGILLLTVAVIFLIMFLAMIITRSWWESDYDYNVFPTILFGAILITAFVASLMSGVLLIKLSRQSRKDIKKLKTVSGITMLALSAPFGAFLIRFFWLMANSIGTFDLLTFASVLAGFIVPLIIGILLIRSAKHSKTNIAKD